MSESSIEVRYVVACDYEGLGPKFCLHLGELIGQLRTIDVYRAEWARLGWEGAFNKGWRAQWSALNYLALLVSIALGTLARSPEEHAFIDAFAERRAELELAFEAHRLSLDWSRKD